MKFDASEFNQTMNGFTTSLGSFPIGGGDCGANVWISDDAKLNLLLSKTDCFSEASRLLKLGFLQLSFDSPLFSDENPPAATVHLEKGCVEITDKNKSVEITVSAFSDMPLYGIDICLKEAGSVNAALNNYRCKKRKIDSEDDSARTYLGAPFDIFESADIVNLENPSVLSWYHHNCWSYYSSTLRNQHLKNLKRADPIFGRTFGCSVAGKGFELSDSGLHSQKAKKHTLYIYAGCEITDNAAEWSRIQGENLLKAIDEYDFTELLNKTEDWWQSYFNDCFLEFSGDDDAKAVTRGYTLQKYLLGCSSRGKMPIKFNGSLFTVEPSPFCENDYDYRRWGDNYWLQNTRLIYWDMLYSGHFEGMLPFFDLVYDIIPECRERCRALFGHGGILLPETFSFFGTYSDFDFGYGQENSVKPECRNNYIRWHYNGALEVSYMMLRFREYTGEKYRRYFDEKLLPFITGVLEFFKAHFMNVDGKMRLMPVSSLETWQDCVDDTPDIAGLLAVIRGLENAGYDSPVDENDIPDIPLAEKNGTTVIAPCRYSFRPEQQNCENTELYPLFPFELYRYDMNADDKKLLSDTFSLVPNRHIFGWSQMCIWAAMLGNKEYCRENITANFKAVNEKCFFGAYFGPNFDWTPDQDHGCSASVAAIFTALQSYGKDVFINPALPENWNVRFRLPSSCGMVEYDSQNRNR